MGWVSWADLTDLVASPLVALPVGAAIAWVSSRLQRRADRQDDVLNEAIVAVSRLQAARIVPNALDGVHFLSQPERAETAAKLRNQAIIDFIEAARAARFALAAADPYVPGGLVRFWNKFEVAESEREEVVTTLLRARRGALFRFRQHSPTTRSHPGG
jgi:hypothetical protein